MKLVPFAKLTDRQRIATCFHGHLVEGGKNTWADWLIPVRNDGRVSRAKGTHGITPEYERRMLTLPGHARPEKGDLSAWRPGVTFHFSRD